MPGHGAVTCRAMRFGAKLPRSFFEQPCTAVARELIGCVLVRVLPNGVRLAGLLVEAEAYLGDGSDPGSHSHRGCTERNRSMFGPAGQLYAYRSYGIHTCVNLVCGEPGVGAAVLLRAVEPLDGMAQMQRLRGLGPDAPIRRIASGPGRLAQAFGLSVQHDGTSALGPELCVRRSKASSKALAIVVGPRVGLTKGADLPYRFHLDLNPHVSPWRAGKRRVALRRRTQ